MPVDAEWYDKNHHILILRYRGNWTIEEAKLGIQKIDTLIGDIRERYDIISDMSEASYTPPVGLLWEWQLVAEKRAIEFSNWGLTVVVTTSELLKAYFEEVRNASQSVDHHTQLVRSVEEAISLIMADRSSKNVSSHT